MKWPRTESPVRKGLLFTSKRGLVVFRSNTTPRSSQRTAFLWKYLWDILLGDRAGGQGGWDWGSGARSLVLTVSDLLWDRRQMPSLSEASIPPLWTGIVTLALEFTPRLLGNQRISVQIAWACVKSIIWQLRGILIGNASGSGIWHSSPRYLPPRLKQETKFLCVFLLSPSPSCYHPWLLGEKVVGVREDLKSMCFT